MMSTHTVHLPTGTLSLSYQSAEFELHELIDFAQRINPKRSFLFVSPVLGRHIPVAPHQMRHAFSTLAHKLPDDLPTPLLIIGMAETATGLSAGVHDALKARYRHAILLNSTRHTQDAPLLTTFSEEHSHASTHLIYLSGNKAIDDAVLSAKTVVMVDDEASTGKTCQNVINALIKAGLNQIKQVHLMTLVDWSLGNEQTINSAIDFYRHHLLSGTWQWTKTANLELSMPDVATTKAGSAPIFKLPSWGRTPTHDSTQGLSALLKALPDIKPYIGKKVLVLGVNEFVWLPFLLAEHLEKLGCLVKFGALTRSPIMMGGAIRHRLEFHDCYGLGMTNFVYNVDKLVDNLLISLFLLFINNFQHFFCRIICGKIILLFIKKNYKRMVPFLIILV